MPERDWLLNGEWGLRIADRPTMDSHSPLYLGETEPKKTEPEHRIAVKDQRLSSALGKQIHYMFGNGGGGREAWGLDAE